MPETLLLRERVRNTIDLGESHFREFKSARDGLPTEKKPRQASRICADIGEALVAFANADGGELLIGVEDDGRVSGLYHRESDVALMLAAPKSHVHRDSSLPMTAATKLEIDGKDVLFFSVAKGTTQIFQLPDGRCVRRKDKNTEPETVQRLLFDRQEVKSRTYDREFVDGATVSDLDVEGIESLANEYLRGLSVERFLQQIGVGEYTPAGLRVRMAGLLLFAKDVHIWHPRSQVRVLKVAGTELKSGENYNVTSDETVQGNVFELLRESWERLRPFLAYKTEFGPEARFEQKYVYPEWACREALVNAIAHRDYSIQNGIDVFIFDDRMEIRSPGALLSTLTIKALEELEGAHESRNALVAKVLRESKYMRELGEGMKRIFHAMEEYELDKPKLFSDEYVFSVTLPSRSVFTSRQEQWLEMFAMHRLTPLQKKIVVLGLDDAEISPGAIYKAMNTDDRNTYDREVTGLRKRRVMKEIRTAGQATSLSSKLRKPKAEIARFKIELPDSPKGNAVPNGRGNQGATSNRSACCVYVSNVPYSTAKADLEQLFAKCGRVLRLDLPLDYKTRRPRGFGFVTFESQDAAEGAVSTLNGALFQGRELLVRPYRVN